MEDRMSVAPRTSDATMDHLFVAQGTFMSVPSRREVAKPDVAIVGVPFDVGTHPYRIGARQGPNHIRHHSAPARRYLADQARDPIGRLAVADWGNVEVVPGRPDLMPDTVATAIGEIVDLGAVPIALGGDGTITLPLLRALRQAHGDLAVVHFDAHTDSYPLSPGERLTTSTTFTCAVQEGLIRPANSLHLGVRGTAYFPDTIKEANSLGFQTVTCEDLLAAGPVEAGELIRDRTNGLPTYLCWDMDFYDPAAAPGVAAPEWGGVTAREGIAFLRSLDGLTVVGADVGTVSPPHDCAGMTGSLAARTVLEILALLAPSGGRDLGSQMGAI